jgi:hypothetical protein
MIPLILAIFMLAQQAQEGPKVFIDSVAYAPGVYSGASIISAPEIASRFQTICPPCRVTIKKESADYVVVFAAAQAQGSSGRWSWAAYENKDGLLLRKGDTFLFNHSIKDAANTIWAHWSHADLPAITVDPDAPKAKIYFFRDEGFSGSMINPEILCDGIAIAKLTKHKFLAIELEAGPHEFIAKIAGGQLEPISLTLDAGQEVYIGYHSAFARVKFEQEEKDKAIKKINKLEPEEEKNVQDKRRISFGKPQQ